MSVTDQNGGFLPAPGLMLQDRRVFSVKLWFMTVQDDKSVTAYKGFLLSRRAELEHLAETRRDDRRPVELDQTRVGRLSRMDALQSQAMAVATERRRSLELTRIAAALQRIDEGEYGYCVACGDEIPVKRLELDPTTTVCVACAAGPSRH